MSPPRLSISFTGKPYIIGAVCLLALVAGALLAQLSHFEALAESPLIAEKAPALPAKAPASEQALLQGVHQHPWRFFYLLQQSQQAGVQLKQLAWQGASKPILIEASAEKYSQILAWQDRLQTQFGNCTLSDVSPASSGNGLSFKLELAWSR